ncbi:MAG: ferritin-like domain-containing protein [Nevskia sp.]|nr:ferritin-like domain-containing protein [Nevskia sp.]
MAQERHWTLGDIPWHEIRPEHIAGSDELFYMVATASFIETTSDLYTRNLVRHFAGDPEVSHWLEHGWEPEELQHGAALREYVRHAWPDFDWQAQYAAFLADYGRTCKPENLLPERSLEMVSRCVVEMGTSCYYTALHHASNEPVLAQLTRHIYEDEVGHYKHFYKYYQFYREQENVSRKQVLGALWHRLKMIEDEDTYIALRHVYAWHRPGKRYDKAVYRKVVKRCRKLVSRYFPHHMSARMLLKPLEMTPVAQRVVEPVVEGMTKLVMF